MTDQATPQRGTEVPVSDVDELASIVEDLPDNAAAVLVVIRPNDGGHAVAVHSIGLAQDGIAEWLTIAAAKIATDSSLP